MRPVIKIPKEPIDIFVEVVGLLALSVMIILPILYWNELPDMVPRHFNGQGQPDAWSKKESLWVLPVVSFVLFAGMYYVTTIPHKFNYTQKITPENAFNSYKSMGRVLRILNTTVAVAFAYTFYSTFQVARGLSEGLGVWFVPVFLFATLIVPILLIQQGQNKKSKTVSK